MVQLSGHRICDAHTMLYDAVKLGKNPALPGPFENTVYNFATKISGGGGGGGGVESG